MSHPSLFLFAAVYLAAIATPGPGIAALVARVLANGLKGVVPFILGYVIGDWIWLVFAASGLQVIAKNFAPLFLIVKYAGAAYLMVMAIQMWRKHTEGAKVIGERDRRNGWQLFLSSLTLTIGNPKVIVFFVSILPLVVDYAKYDPAGFRRDFRGLRGLSHRGSQRLCSGRQRRPRAVSIGAGDAEHQPRRRDHHGRRGGGDRDAVKALSPWKQNPGLSWARHRSVIGASPQTPMETSAIFWRQRRFAMSKSTLAEHHTKAAEHHEAAAKHHHEAAEAHAEGDHDLAHHHAHIAHGHHLNAAASSGGSRQAQR